MAALLLFLLVETSKKGGKTHPRQEAPEARGTQPLAAAPCPGDAQLLAPFQTPASRDGCHCALSPCLQQAAAMGTAGYPCPHPVGASLICRQEEQR